MPSAVPPFLSHRSKRRRPIDTVPPAERASNGCGLTALSRAIGEVPGVGDDGAQVGVLRAPTQAVAELPAARHLFKMRPPPRWGHGPLGPMKRSNETGAGLGPLEPMKGSNESCRTASSVGPMDGSNQAGAGLVRWIDGKVKPGWRRASSVGTDGRVGRPAPWLWPVVGRSDPLRVPRI